MTEQEHFLILTIKGAIAELSPSEQQESQAAYLQMKQIVETGNPALLALALLGAEKQAE